MIARPKTPLEPTAGPLRRSTILDAREHVVCYTVVGGGCDSAFAR